MSFLAALATGLLLWASYPPVNVGPLVWVALVPLLAVLWPSRSTPPGAGTPTAPAPRPAWWRPTRAAGAFLHGYIAGATFFLLNLSWLRHVTALGMVMLALYLALYPAFWALFAATVGRPRQAGSGWELARAVAVTAAAWTGLEWLRGIVLTGFGWNGLGVALAEFANGSVAQWAEWIGVTGLSFFVVALAALLVGRWRTFGGKPGLTPARRLLAGVGYSVLDLLILLFMLGSTGEKRAKSVAATMANCPTLTVALIQPNIPQENKNLLDSFDTSVIALATLTQQAFDTEPKPDLLVWPESSLPAPYFDPLVQDVLTQGSALGDFTHILGIDDQEIDAYFNSIAVFRGDPRQATLYRKVHLVPFGEYLPARGLFGRFDFIREQLPGDFKAGDLTDPVPLPQRATTALPGTEATETGGAADDDSEGLSGGPSTSAVVGDAKNSLPRVADPAPALSLIPLVCFEDTLGRVARRFARDEPQLIVNVTNDAWFQDSAGADQHLANAVFRSIELRRPMIRAANTGVTAVVDPLGRITHRLPRLQEGQLKASVPRPTTGGRTLYARVGDAFSVLMLALAGAAVVSRPWVQRASRRDAGRRP